MDEQLAELEAQIESHGVGKLIFFLNASGEMGEDLQLTITDIKFDGENIQVTLE